MERKAAELTAIMILNRAKSASETERKQAEEALCRAHHDLEERVRQRTADLAKANKALRAEIAERKQAEDALRESREIPSSCGERQRGHHRGPGWYAPLRQPQSCSKPICFNALGGLSYMRHCKIVGLGRQKSCGERFANLKKLVAEVNKQCWRPKHSEVETPATVESSI